MTTRFAFTRFMDRFSDEELETVWDYSGLGDVIGDPEAPFPGRQVMAKFLVPIPGSWRDILLRAVRTMPLRRDLAALRALLRQVVSHYQPPVPRSAPTPAVLVSQCHRIAIAPTRGSPVGLLRRRGPDMT